MAQPSIVVLLLRLIMRTMFKCPTNASNVEGVNSIKLLSRPCSKSNNVFVRVAGQEFFCALSWIFCICDTGDNDGGV